MDWLNNFGKSSTDNTELNANFKPAPNLDLAKVGAFEGTGEALQKALPSAYHQTLSSLDDFVAGKLEVEYGTGWTEDALYEEPENAKETQEQAAEVQRNLAKAERLKVKNDYTPNPETTGAAAMLLHGLTGSLAKAIGYTALTGGNIYAAGAAFGADLGIYEAGKLKDKGVDEDTANLAGWITGISSGVGMALPGSIGTRYLTGMGFGVGVNLGSTVAEQASIRFILDNANYAEISKEYDPFDPTALTASGVMGAAFGALGVKGARVRARALENERPLNEKAEPEQTRTPEEITAEQNKKETDRYNADILRFTQNRDRSNKNSVEQMRAIAAGPDFNRLRGGSNLESGTPVIAYVPQGMNIVEGKSVVVSGQDGRRMNMKYAIVDAKDVMTSNDVNGGNNPNYANPDVVGARAIAGNGRIAGLVSSYREGHAGKYKQELTDNLGEFGIGFFKRKAVKDIENPILVRIMEDKDVSKDIGEVSNRTGVQRLDTAEQAAQDARNVNLDDVKFKADGEITDESVERFAKGVPDKDGLTDSYGNIILDNVRGRLKAAIISGAYGDSGLVNRFITNTGKNAKERAEMRVFDVLIKAAPNIIRLKHIGGDYDFSRSIIEAVADVFQTKQETKGTDVEKTTMSLFGASKEQQFFREILLSKHPEEIENVSRRLAEISEQETAMGDGMFEPVTREQVFQTVLDEFKDLDLTPDINNANLVKGAAGEITQSHVDAALEVQAANTIQSDQPASVETVARSVAD